MSTLEATAAEIRAAIDHDRLALVWQPIVELVSRRVVWHELLVRMPDVHGNLRLPAAFLPTAERAGLMPALDALVTRRGLALAGAGHAVTINLSAQSLSLPSPISQLVEAAIVAGLDPARVMFEITETAEMAAEADGYSVVRSLSGLGCRIALDDFGTGFGCFRYLKHIPADFLKIDRDFIGRGGAIDMAIVRAIATVAADLGMSTIAEGVEDAEVADALREIGVDHVQGYFTGAPAPIDLALLTGRSG